MRLLQEPTLNQKKILVIDKSPKTKNDRTWCFWEQKNGLFEEIVNHRWHKIKFLSNQFSAQLNIAPYTYKMLHGIDFYNYVINYAMQFKNVEFRYEKVDYISTEKLKASAIVANETFTSDYIFNSILFEKPEIPKGKFYLLQHFKGWVIKTKQPSFDPSVATFMDFTVSQKHGTTFMYIMPTSSTEALVEYTLFTEKLLQQSDYDGALRNYILNTLKITDHTIEHEEFGIIPMTNINFPKHNGRLVNIGIAGGQAKGSSGYAFQFIQKRTAKIVASLTNYNHPFTATTFTDKIFNLYDSVLLNVLHYKKLNGDKIFADIFEKNKPKTIFKFLDNESNLLDDLQIMNSLPITVFFKAAVEEMF